MDVLYTCFLYCLGNSSIPPHNMAAIIFLNNWTHLFSLSFYHIGNVGSISVRTRMLFGYSCVSCPIIIVILPAAPLQIFNPIINFDFVLMIYAIVFIWVWQKRHCDKAMNKAILAMSIFTQYHS